MPKLTIFMLCLLPTVVWLGGCAGKGNDGLIIFEPFLAPTPGQAARDMFDWSDADKRRRGVALISAAEWGGAESYQRLYRLLLEDPDDSVRAAAIKALGQHGTVEDAPRISLLLAHRTDFVRWEAAQALQKIHNPDVVGALTRALVTDRDADVRMAAAVALGQYPQPSVYDALVGALTDADFGVTYAARQSLTTLTGADQGPDPLAWLSWSKIQAGRLFANQQIYVWRPYQKPRGLWDRAQFWKKHQPVEPRQPTGAESANISTWQPQS